MSERPTGFTCSACGKRHEFTGYAAAHWDHAMRHKCDKCGASHVILRGVATPSQVEPT